MAYSLRAFIGHLETLNMIQEYLPDAVVIPLEQQVGMIPVTQAVYQAIGDERPALIWDTPIFQGLSTPLVNCAVFASANGPIAYIEAEYFSGEGYQAAVVWKDEKEVLGPFLAYKFPLHEKPINRTLRLLGVQVNGGIDEFDTLGLGACRRTDDWVSRVGT